MRVFTAALAVSLAVPLSTLSAQQPPSVGERVRISQCHSELSGSGYPRDVCERSVGTLSALSANIGTLRVEEEATELVFALDSVASLEVVRGQKRRVGRGMLMGLAIGGGGLAVIGTVAMAASPCIDSPDPCPLLGTFMGAIVGVPLGLLVGGVAGAFVKTDRWEEVPLDRLRVSFAPRRDGFAFGMRVAF